jgi:hypothetical protein
MGEQQADVVLLRPDVYAPLAQRVKLPGIPGQSPPVVAAGKLEKGGVQPHDADAAKTH